MHVNNFFFGFMSIHMLFSTLLLVLFARFFLAIFFSLHIYSVQVNFVGLSAFHIFLCLFLLSCMSVVCMDIRILRFTAEMYKFMKKKTEIEWMDERSRTKKKERPLVHMHIELGRKGHNDTSIHTHTAKTDRARARKHVLMIKILYV